MLKRETERDERCRVSDPGNSEGLSRRESGPCFGGLLGDPEQTRITECKRSLKPTGHIDSMGGPFMQRPSPAYGYYAPVSDRAGTADSE